MTSRDAYGSISGYAEELPLDSGIGGRQAQRQIAASRLRPVGFPQLACSGQQLREDDAALRRWPFVRVDSGSSGRLLRVLDRVAAAARDCSRCASGRETCRCVRETAAETVPRAPWAKGQTVRRKAPSVFARRWTTSRQSHRRVSQPAPLASARFRLAIERVPPGVPGRRSIDRAPWPGWNHRRHQSRACS